MNYCVVGLQWGDEGKGKVVDILAEHCDIVVRYGGGANAGHTVVVGDSRFALHLLPSGSVRPNTTCVIANGVVVDPDVLTKEIETLAQRGISLNGRLYTELPTAFQYRKAMSPACSCRKPGESWAQTMKGVGPDDTVVPGDVVVTDQNSKQLSQPRVGPDGKPIRPDSRAPATATTQPSGPEMPVETDPAKRKVRSVGPTFIPAR